MSTTAVTTRTQAYDHAHRTAVTDVIARFGIDEIVRRSGYSRSLLNMVYAGTRNVTPGLVWAMEKHGLLEPGAGEGSKATHGPALRSDNLHPTGRVIPGTNYDDDDLDEDGDVDFDDLSFSRHLENKAHRQRERIERRCGQGVR